VAAAIASHSRHPYSQALAAHGTASAPIAFDEVTEHPGAGLEARSGRTIYRLGRSDWAATDSANATVVLSKDGKSIAAFELADQLRAGASEAIAELKAAGLQLNILSGDSSARVDAIASRLGLAGTAAARPADKVAAIEALKHAGHAVLMVGDGLNDAPALRATDVSMAPSSAADIGRIAADLVFLRESLAAVPQAIAMARRAARLVRQNFVLAIAYNLVAIPLGILGEVTPLVAAVAMSASSIIVVANALRLGQSGHSVREPTLPDAREFTVEAAE
jgi:Cu2+-exporting ATPase